MRGQQHLIFVVCALSVACPGTDESSSKCREGSPKAKLRESLHIPWADTSGNRALLSSGSADYFRIFNVVG